MCVCGVGFLTFCALRFPTNRIKSIGVDSKQNSLIKFNTSHMNVSKYVAQYKNFKL